MPVLTPQLVYLTMRWLLLSIILTAATSAWADDCGCHDRVRFRTDALKVSSGPVRHSGSTDAPEIVYSEVVSVKDAQWLRLSFGRVRLSGDPASGNASYLRIVSLADLAVQRLDSESLSQWSDTTAYFNGSQVLLQLVAHKGSGPSEVTVSDAHVGLPPPPGAQSLCGTDNRTLSSDPRAGRHLPEGCTAWLHDDLNKTFLTAGHCGVSQGDVIQFNVPLSSSNGSLNHPAPEDQYPVEPTSVQFQNGGAGNDWCYFATFPNSNTGLTAFQKQGQFYTKSAAAPTVSGQTIRITGYGTVSSPVSATWQQVQKTHAGPYFSMSGTLIRYQVDTTGGNSGSCVFNENTSQAIGIHTHAGCTSTGGSNQGTAIHHPNLQAALANPKGICRSGRDAVAPPIYLAGDLNNNFGTLNIASGAFGKISEIPAQLQGLAYDRNLGLFYCIDSSNRLFTVQPASGAATLLGTVNATGVVNGLGFDPNAGTLYGILQANGQLVRIDRSSLVASAIGTPNGGVVGALDYDPDTNSLFGLDDANGATRLIRFDPSSGARTVVGTLGTGAVDCNGLAANDRDGFLYTVNSTTGSLLKINKSSGLATAVGPTNGLFGASYGMAAEGFRYATVFPQSLQMSVGFVNGGSLAQVQASDNAYLSLITGPRLNRTSPMVQAIFTATSSVPAPNAMTVKIESASPNWDQVVDLFNYSNGLWETVDSMMAGQVDSLRQVAITSNASRFVNGSTGEMRLRVSWQNSSQVV
ncbi:MAG TPA: trypsin-like serine protease, partial [Fimbriimonadaceae bacterium]|nr:trypsin-like serine protease [Fimbriimonadaceae bacterium]